MAVRRAVLIKYGKRDSIPAMLERDGEKEKMFAPEVAAEKKGCGFMLVYPVIDAQETGKHLKEECERRRVTPREIQEFLGLAALQSVYEWFRGNTLPSLDNFYALSCFLGARMEELVVPQHRGREVPVRDAFRSLERRMMAYQGFCLQALGGGRAA